MGMRLVEASDTITCLDSSTDEIYNDYLVEVVEATILLPFLNSAGFCSS